jgi:hypothetical protein
LVSLNNNLGTKQLTSFSYGIDQHLHSSHFSCHSVALARIEDRFEAVSKTHKKAIEDAVILSIAKKTAEKIQDGVKNGNSTTFTSAQGVLLPSAHPGRSVLWEKTMQEVAGEENDRPTAWMYHYLAACFLLVREAHSQGAETRTLITLEWRTITYIVNLIINGLASTWHWKAVLVCQALASKSPLYFVAYTY